MASRGSRAPRAPGGTNTYVPKQYRLYGKVGSAVGTLPTHGLPSAYGALEKTAVKWVSLNIPFYFIIWFLGFFLVFSFYFYFLLFFFLHVPLLSL